MAKRSTTLTLPKKQTLFAFKQSGKTQGFEDPTTSTILMTTGMGVFKNQK